MKAFDSLRNRNYTEQDLKAMDNVIMNVEKAAKVAEHATMPT